MKNIDRKLNKIYAGAIAILMITLVLGSVWATRTITDSSDTIETMIRCSNGNSYTATDANLQTAITSLAGNPGTVYLPAGTIYVDQEITIGSNCHIQGAGMYQTTLRMTGATAAVWSILKCIQKSNIVLSDFTVHGNNTLSGGSADDDIAIDVREGNNIKIENVRIMYPSDEACHISTTGGYSYGCKNLSINNFIVRDIREVGAAHHGLALGYVYNATISNIDIHGSYSTGDGIDCGGLYNCEFNNIIISNVTADGWKLNSNVKNVTINNVVMNDVLNHGFKLAGTDIGHLTINNIKMNTGSKGIYIYANTGYPIIIDNFYIIAGGNGIETTGISPYNQNITISNGVIETTGDNGILLTATSRNITISKVTVKIADDNGIYAAGGSDIKILNCNVFNSVDSWTNQGAIKLRNTNRVLVDGCTLRNGKSWGIYVDGCNNVTIVNNDISGFTVSGYGGMNFTAAITKGIVLNNNRVTGNSKSIYLYNAMVDNIIAMGNYIISNTYVPHNATGITWSQIYHNGPQEFA